MKAKQLESAMNTFLRYLITHPWRTLMLAMLVLMATLYGARQLVQNNDVRLFFDPAASSSERFASIEKEYGARDSLTFVIQFSERMPLFSVRGLQLVEQLTEQAWQLPHVRRVQSLSNFQAVDAQADSLGVSALVKDPAQLSEAQVARIRSLALDEPLIMHGLVSAGGDAALVGMALNLKGADSMAARAVVSAARAMARDFEAHYKGAVQIHVFGTAAISDAFDSETQKALSIILPLALIVMLVFMRYILGNWGGAMLTLLVASISIASAMGLGGYMGIELTPITAYTPIILLTVAIATTTHLLVCYQEHLEEAGQAESILFAYRDNLYPILLANITTLMGFLSLNASQSIPFQGLGNLVAAGVVCVLFYSFVLLPVLLSLIKARRNRRGLVQLERGLGALYRLVVAHHLKISVVSIGASVVMGWLALGNVFNDNVVDYFAPQSEIGTAVASVKHLFPGFNSIEFSFPAPQGVTDPVYLNYLERLNTWAQSREEVTYVVSLAEVIKRLNQGFNGGDAQYRSIPADRELIAQYLLMYSSSLPRGLDMSDLMPVDQGASLVVIKFKADSTQQILAFRHDVETWVASNFPREMRQLASGFEPTFAETSMHNSRSVMENTLWAVLLISASLIIAFMSLRIGLLCLLMNLLPGMIALGVWCLLNGNMGMSVAIVFDITIGIIVDDTIHFMARLQTALRRYRLGLEEALWFAFQKSGVAIVTTSLVLIINFGLIATADFFPMSSMGLVSVVTVTAALVCNLLVLPALLLSWRSLRHKRDLADAAANA
jgi:predicted RND superfamily exporter protein